MVHVVVQSALLDLIQTHPKLALGLWSGAMLWEGESRSENQMQWLAVNHLLWSCVESPSQWVAVNPSMTPVAKC
jgi:hypothetical protein